MSHMNGMQVLPQKFEAVARLILERLGNRADDCASGNKRFGLEDVGPPVWLGKTEWTIGQQPKAERGLSACLRYSPFRYGDCAFLDFGLPYRNAVNRSEADGCGATNRVNQDGCLAQPFAGLSGFVGRQPAFDTSPENSPLA